MFKLSPVLFLLLIISSCNDKVDSQSDDNNYTPTPPPASISYNLLGTHPHDTSSFTEGLQWYEGSIYESTGNKGFSKLLKINPGSGKTEKELKLADEYFGEGLTVLRDTIYQMTWQEKVVLVYDAKTFKQIKTLTNDNEGWGMTTDSTYLIVTDGSSNLYYRDPSTFRLIKTVGVTDNNGPVSNINELEYVDGFIYANLWNTNYIVKIDPNTGNVVGRVDLSGILEQAVKETPDPNRGNVLNGIAYNPETKTFLVTGKNWPVMFEMKF
ncbi:glutaminyl-peptide cyclotransferase [Segetibacter sp. 3557_3]|uniref:glutaminyl-peptide cyclotransferase n=1 Tax=Segetibacter sp. 3557_3 TaxID=2547429 RepID=UPI001058879D|nr:glutaminyl-peptide cyclotransferase [Segetibacter sp. 3557_3]TDH29306.1 glutaminyl-peptide cyclotransferase [Segetibacter sp. 3557_3]